VGNGTQGSEKEGRESCGTLGDDDEIMIATERDIGRRFACVVHTVVWVRLLG
jgi:hypothetical protein